MKQRIQRTYDLSKDELRTAVIFYLRTYNHPSPFDAFEGKWTVTNDGMHLEWTEVIDK